MRKSSATESFPFREEYKRSSSSNIFSTPGNWTLHFCASTRSCGRRKECIVRSPTAFCRLLARGRRRRRRRRLRARGPSRYLPSFLPALGSERERGGRSRPTTTTTTTTATTSPFRAPLEDVAATSPGRRSPTIGRGRCGRGRRVYFSLFSAAIAVRWGSYRPSTSGSETGQRDRKGS